MHRDIRHCKVWVGGALAAALLSTQTSRADDVSVSISTAQQTTQLEQTSTQPDEVPVQAAGFGLHYGRYGYGRYGFGRFGYRPYYASRFRYGYGYGYGYPYGRYGFYRPWYYGSYYRPYFYRSSFYRPWYTYPASFYASRPYYSYYSYAPIGYSYYAPAYYTPTYNYAPSCCTSYYYGAYGLGCLY